jgi:hypothetical protein
MKKYFFSLIVATLIFALIGCASAFDVGISTEAGWFGQAAADAEMKVLSDAIKAKVGSVTLFPADKQADLATWVKNNTGDKDNDILILCGTFPSTIYAPGNTQVDNSLAELFLDSGNTIINTGDWMFYVVTGGPNNGTAGLQNMMDIPGISMDGEGDNQPMVVTKEGKSYTPSLKDFLTDRPLHLDKLVAPWKPLIILAQNAAGTRSDPCIVTNTTTKGSIGIFFQTAGQDTDPRGKVMSEFILSYYATSPVSPLDSSATTWGAIKGN